VYSLTGVNENCAYASVQCCGVIWDYIFSDVMSELHPPVAFYSQGKCFWFSPYRKLDRPYGYSELGIEDKKFRTTVPGIESWLSIQ
jgi:hypothetical protein